MITGPAIFYDGKTSARRDVRVEVAPDLLRICAPDGPVLEGWPYRDLEAMSAPGDVLRIGRKRSATLARLEIRDTALAAAIDDMADTIDRTGKMGRRQRHKVIAWTFAATMSLILVTVFGLSAIVERLTPLIPASVEHRLGLAVDRQVRAMLDNRRGDRPFECGSAESEQKGRAALGRLVGALENAAQLPAPLNVTVVRRSEANAIALPGGHIYVFEGLVRKSEAPDELAGVLAHEIGHVAHRDGTRSILQAAGMSLLLGMLLGDFTGGGVAVVAARTIMQSAYAREVESAADLYGVQLMANVGGDPRALGVVLERITGSIEPGVKILLDHPITKDRVAAINAAAPSGARKPLLSADEWTALKRICG